MVIIALVKAQMFMQFANNCRSQLLPSLGIPNKHTIVDMILREWRLYVCVEKEVWAINSFLVDSKFVLVKNATVKVRSLGNCASCVDDTAWRCRFLFGKYCDSQSWCESILHTSWCRISYAQLLLSSTTHGQCVRVSYKV